MPKPNLKAPPVIEPVDFDSVETGDIVSLNEYPYKPFEIAWKMRNRLALECMHPKQIRCATSRDNFNAAGYWLSTQTET